LISNIIASQCSRENSRIYFFASRSPSTPTITLTHAPTLAPTRTIAARPTLEPSPTSKLSAIKTSAWFNDDVLYEIFPRSFYDSNGDGIGALNGIPQKLDYLKSLGVGALWLTLVFASSDHVHGYATVDY
jgi:hypothetical protein